MPDNYDQYVMHEHGQMLEERRLPICANCGERIMSEQAYNIDGLWCEKCFNEWVDNISVWVDSLGVCDEF